MTGDPAVGRSESVEEFDTSCAAASRLISNAKIWSNGTRSGEGRDITQKKEVCLRIKRRIITRKETTTLPALLHYPDPVIIFI